MDKYFSARRRVFVLAIALAANFFSEFGAMAQSAGAAYPALKNATILIIRHAEKPESGYGLSPAGEERAQAYVKYFETFTVASQPARPDYLFATVDSKGSHRPRLTLEPLSHALGIRIDDRFKDKNCADLAREIQSHYHGKDILIAWHHGAIPELLQDLGADPSLLLPNGKWPSDVFGWVIELRFDGEGRLIAGASQRLNERLMPDDSNH